MMAALDRALELNPEHLDGLSSKAAFLVRLPAFLGGDRARGEWILRAQATLAGLRSGPAVAGP